MGREHPPGWLRISLHRAGAQRGLLGALAALTGVASLLLTGIVGFLTLSANAHVTGALDAATETERTLVLQTRSADDAGAQHRAATELLDRALGTPGLLLAEPPVLVEVTSDGTFTRWTVAPNPDGMTADALPGLIRGLETLPRAFLDDDRVNIMGVTAEGSLATTLAAIHERVAAEQTGNLVPVLLVIVATGVALAQSARLLAGARAPEFALLRSRGASARRLWLAAAMEAAVVAVLAAALGAAVAIAALGGTFDGASAGWGLAALVALAATIVTTAAARSSIGSATVHESAFLSRGRTATGAAATGIVVLLAAVSLAQFLTAGSPLVTDGRGRSTIDPFVASAPALVLLAAIALGLALAAPLARGLDGWAARSLDVLPVLPVRQVTRRPAMHVATATMAAVTAGTIVVAAGYAGTLDRVANMPAELAMGADVRVAWGSDPAPDATVLAALEGATASAGVLTLTARYGEDPVELVALPADAADTVLTDLDGSLDLAAARRALAPGSPIPAVITSAFADRFDLAVGDPLTLTSPVLVTGFDLVVAGTLSAVPGTTGTLGVLADLAAVSATLGEVDVAWNPLLETWFASTDPAATATAIATLAPGAQVRTHTAVAAMTPTTGALWLAAIGGIVLAGAAMAASAALSGRARASETAVLRALGMSRRQLGAGARLEFSGVVVASIVVGAASGLVVCMLTVGSLARAATLGLPGALAVPLVFDLPALALASAALLAVAGAVALRPSGGGRR